MNEKLQLTAVARDRRRKERRAIASLTECRSPVRL